jgi:SAM-dependent methyltransferase
VLNNTFDRCVIGATLVVMLSHLRAKSRKARLEFWQKWLGPECPWPQARAERLQKGRPLPQWAAACAPPGLTHLRILDVNAGPVTSLGVRSSTLDVELIPIDELARNYDRLLDEMQVVPPLRTQFCNPEDCLTTFGNSAFDCIYSHNGLFTSEDPVPFYQSLLQCLRPSGSLIFFLDFTEDPHVPQRNAMRFFHMVRNDRVIIVQKGFRRDLADMLPQACITFAIEGNLLRLEMRPQRVPVPLSPAQPAARQGQDLPKLLSMHIPKTAGTSFRKFLEQLYGSRLRLMYSEADTAPRLRDKVRVDPSTLCLHGHFQADALFPQLPGAALITWIRDPVQRVISSYFQMLRNPECAEESAFNKAFFQENWSIMEFARKDEIRRQVLWYFNAVPLADFFFIGVSEWYEASMALFCHRMGIEPMTSVNDSLNTNPNRQQSTYPLSELQLREFKTLFVEEFSLYDQVCAAVRAQCKELGIALD